MTRFEQIRTMTLEEVATALCDIMTEEDGDACDWCCANDHCYLGHVGFIDWLQESVNK